MSDADTQRMARAVAEIASHLRQLNKILETLNGNFVETVSAFKILTGIAEDQTAAMDEQLKFRDHAVEEVLVEDELRRQRPDLFEDNKDPDGEERS